MLVLVPEWNDISGMQKLSVSCSLSMLDTKLIYVSKCGGLKLDTALFLVRCIFGQSKSSGNAKEAIESKRFLRITNQQYSMCVQSS